MLHDKKFRGLRTSSGIFLVGCLTTLLLSRLYSSDFQPVCHEVSAGVSREFGGEGRKEAIKTEEYKNVEICYQHIFKNNRMTRILAIKF
jgi:hypothetical protein